jgi:hypothetical protein
VVCGVPCTEFSLALTTRPRQLEKGDALAKKALEIVKFLRPQKWWLENPRHGYLRHREYMKPYPFVDVDYCQYSDWGYKKPTRIWGSPDILQVQGKLCDGRTCPNLVPGQTPGENLQHDEYFQRQKVSNSRETDPRFGWLER